MANWKGLTISCDCPDASKEKNFLIKVGATYSEQFARNWTKSKAGAQDGICKHIWSVLVIRKLVTKEDLPLDMPVNIDSDDSDTNQELYQSGYGGNSFDNGSFAVPTFKPYRGG